MSRTTTGIKVYVDSQALRDARIAARLTQREVALAAGMTNLQVSRIETGVQNSTIGTMRKLAQVLGVAVDSLIK